MKKLLVILSRVPYPIEKGDKLRAYYQIKQLSQSHEVFVFALNDPGSPASPKSKDILLQFCKGVEIFDLSYWGIALRLAKALISGTPLQVGYFYSKKAEERLNTLIHDIEPDHIYCQLVRTAMYAKPHTLIPATLDYMDALSKGVERRIPKVNGFWKFVYKLESDRLRSFEKNAFHWFKHSLIISGQDRSHLPLSPKERSAIHIIPNGVDMEYFKPMELNKTHDLLYCGNMNYPPNIDAAIYLVHHILPLLIKKQPGIKLMIAGANPSPKVLRLAGKHVTVTGWVDDIRQCYATAKVFLAPMQTSIGMQNKILEAMAMKIPCITSVMANNAIEATNGESILLGTTPEEYAMHAEKLLNNPQKANQMSDKAYEFVHQRYSWKHVSDYLEQIFT